MKKIMYSFKKYSHRWDFISEIPQNFIINKPKFHETMNSWQWELALELSENISENFLKFWELIKIFYEWKLIYSWFVSRREKIFSEKNSIVFYIIWFFDILRNYKIHWLPSYAENIDKYDRNYINWNAILYYQEMIEYLNINSNNFIFDREKITDLSKNHNEIFSWNFLDLLNFFLKEYEMNYFIWADWILKVWLQENHTLFFNKDIFEIKIEVETWDVVNYAEYKAKLKIQDSSGISDEEEYIYVKDEESIKKIWLKYKQFPDYHFWVVEVWNYDIYRKRAEKHIKDILEKAKNPFVNIKIKIFDKKYFWVLKVLDTLTIKNFSEEIENKKIVKITYNENYMEVELENYNILWNILLWQ